MNMFLRNSILVSLSSLLIVLSNGCRHHPDDSTIQNDIQQKVAADPNAGGSQVTVASQDGKVTISGNTPSPKAKTAVDQIAQAEPGVKSVDDQTTFQQAGAMEQPGASSGPPSGGQQEATPPATTAPAAAPMPAPATPPPPPPPPPPIVVPAGTVLTVITSQALSSNGSHTGDTFLATIAQPISVQGTRAIPKGATASGTVLNAQAKGKIKGEGQLDLQLTSLSVRGHTYSIHTSVYSSTEKGKGKRTAVTTGGGAAGGALIGGLAGGGKGAGIGALVGAGAGFVGGAATGNKQIQLPAESALSFTLSGPLTLPPPSQGSPGSTPPSQ
jgi:hypothetical protein